MKLKYKAVMFLTLLIFCVGSVCATEPNNSTTGKISINDSDTFNSVNSNSTNIDDSNNFNPNNNTNIDDSNGFNAGIINSFTNYIIQHNPDVKQLKEKIKVLDEKVNKQELEIKELKERNKVLDEKRDKLSDYLMKLSNNYEKIAYDNKLLAIEKEKLNGENQVLRMKIETLNNEIKELKAKLPN